VAAPVTTPRRNVAVFIDSENLFGGYGKLNMPPVSTKEIIDKIIDAAEEQAETGKVAVARAYADWDQDGLKEYRREVEDGGAKAVGVFAAGIPTKNAADIELVVDCLRYADDDGLEVFAIVSGDGDFVPLVRRLHELGKFVVGATLDGLGTNRLLRTEVDLYVQIPVPPAPAKTPAKTAPAKVVEPAKKAPPTKAPPKKVPAKKVPQQRAEGGLSGPADRKAPTPAKKTNWHEMAKGIPVVHHTAARSATDYKKVVKKVLAEPKVRSFLDQLANQGGTLPILAMALKSAAPELKPSDAKVGSLSRALRFALADTPYALARESDDVQPVLVRRQTKPAGMLPDLTLDDIERGVQ
jgi:uncharacterized LabA/DUF88 family protein